MGKVGLDDAIAEACKVRDFHTQYRRVLKDNVEGYVFDNKSDTLYILVKGEEENLHLLITGYEGLNVGILHVPKERVTAIGHYFSFSDMERCA